MRLAIDTRNVQFASLSAVDPICGPAGDRELLLGGDDLLAVIFDADIDRPRVISAQVVLS